jgi:hypothetical protein
MVKVYLFNNIVFFISATKLQGEVLPNRAKALKTYFAITADLDAEGKLDSMSGILN